MLHRLQIHTRELKLAIFDLPLGENRTAHPEALFATKADSGKLLPNLPGVKAARLYVIASPTQNESFDCKEKEILLTNAVLCKHSSPIRTQKKRLNDFLHSHLRNPQKT